ncbi:Membrane-bound lytic murein transglycosylase B [hydrothermal vent metagenome]|uniref:Membrane-bound lytic murein transglycosylase B n=1 Tax=hydrothermal vent metagenome TaxID=652676 RepID=A0A3B0X2D7_9ZZZZ
MRKMLKRVVMMFMLRKILITNGLILAMAVMVPTVAIANYAQRADVKQFVNEMVEQHGFDRAYLEAKFAGAKKLENVLESIAKPAEKKLTWKRYRPIFVTNKRAEKGKKFIRDNKAVLERAEKKYGVPVEIIAAIIGVESYYGKHTGKYTIFDSLTTLGFDYPKRSTFFRSELKQFLLLSKEEAIDVNTMTGSYAGAMGMPQFISSSYREYAIDFDGDGKRDLWNSLPDVIGSVANYFSRHGWETGGSVVHQATVKNTSIVREKNSLKPYALLSQLEKQGVALNKKSESLNLDKKQKATLLYLKGKKGDEYWLGLNNFYVITRYNHSALYAMAVFQLSEKLKD